MNRMTIKVSDLLNELNTTSVTFLCCVMDNIVLQHCKDNQLGIDIVDFRPSQTHAILTALFPEVFSGGLPYVFVTMQPNWFSVEWQDRLSKWTQDNFGVENFIQLIECGDKKRFRVALLSMLMDNFGDRECQIEFEDGFEGFNVKVIK